MLDTGCWMLDAGYIIRLLTYVFRLPSYSYLCTKPQTLMNHFRFLPSVLCLLFFPFAGLHSQSLPRPKNIIIMIGDGMGYNAIQAADYFYGRKQVYEDFPVKLAMAHYPAKAGEYEANNPASNYWAHGYSTLPAWKDTAWLKSDFTESAAAATALATGFKTYNNSIGFSLSYDTLVNLTQWAKGIGKSTGVVTSVEFSHATPAGFVAHNKVRTNYARIAYEMLLDSRCDVIMGCGNPMYNDNGNKLTGKWKNACYVGDSAFWVQLHAGSGKTTRFLAGGQQRVVSDIDGDGIPDPWTVIQDTSEFRTLMSGACPKRVLGCPKIYSTLQQSRTMLNGETKSTPPFTTPFNAGVPRLSVMVKGALNVLDNNPKGFLVMIEGGAIDWAEHGNQKGRLLEEMKDFDDAVAAVVNWVNANSSWDETMVIVTADHETGLVWGDKPFEPLKDEGAGKLPGFTFYSSNHSNSLVGFFAKGIGSDYYRQYADETDSVRGPYIQNSEVAQLIHFLWPKQK